MSINLFNDEIRKTARNYLIKLENYFKADKADVLFYYGDIDRVYEQLFRNAIESLVVQHKNNQTVKYTTKKYNSTGKEITSI